MPGPATTTVIAGGGTAGWMTAAALAKTLPAGHRIVLVESEEIGIIGVGEATVPSINLFNALMGFAVPDFMRACEATFKLGIEFVDWGELGRSYIHPFTNYGLDVESTAFPALYMAWARAGGSGRLDDFNLACRAAKAGRFVLPRKGQDPGVGPMRYAFHFDAALYAGYLRGHAEKLGVTRVEGRIQRVAQNAESGDITALHLASGEVIAGDIFVDCTGFVGLLIEQTLKAGYDDWSAWLPCNRAIAVPSRNVSPPPAYTRSTADAAGWRWRIPLQHRTGNGHVYAADFMDDDEAERRLLDGLEGPALAAPRRLQFVTGKRRKVWSHNCIAIGLASGFLEPLESTSIYMIQTGIIRLLGLYLQTGFDDAHRAAFNGHATAEFEAIRDFIVLHYKLSTRDDTPFWRHCRDMAVPDAVRDNIARFNATGQVTIPKDHAFPLQGWLAVMLGQGGLPRQVEGAPPDSELPKIEGYLRHVRDVIGQHVEGMPSQQAFLDKILGPRVVTA